MALAARLPDGAALTPLVDETGLSAVVVNLRRCSREERAWWMLSANRGGVGRLRYAGTDANELLFLVDRQGASLPAPIP